MHKRRLIIEGACALICLIMGCCIYCMCRSHILFMDWMGISGTIPILHTPISIWCVYSLPDGLWYMSLLLLIDLLCQVYSNLSNQKITPNIMMSFAVILPFIIEIAQKRHIIYGIYDIVDIYTYLITLIIFLLLCGKNYFLLSRFK